MIRLTAAVLATVLHTGLAIAAPPPTPKVPVTTEYHGVKVTEDYRWLEDWNNSDVRAWSEGQNAYARAFLDKLPDLAPIKNRVREIMTANVVTYYDLNQRGQRLFAMKNQPPKQQPFLVVMPSANRPDAERALVDPNAIDAEGLTAIDWYVPSPDGRLVAVSLSRGGSEAGDVHIYETTGGRQVHEVIPRVNGGTAGGDLSWSSDGTGFFYTRYPRGKERPAEDLNFYQQVYFHQLGTPTKSDRYEIGRDFPRIAEIQLDTDIKTGLVLATVQNGDGGEFAHYLRDMDRNWRQFSRFGDGTLVALFGSNNDLFLVSRAGAPRGKILHMPIDALDAARAKTIVPEGTNSIVTEFAGPPSILTTDTRLYVEYQLGGPSEIRVFDHTGKPAKSPKQLPVSSVSGLTKARGDDLLFNDSSFIDPPAWYRFDSKTGVTSKTALFTRSPVDYSDTKVIREFATSKDGTKVPVNIIMPKNAKLDGSNPCIVNGYGGYGVNITPRFSATRRVLLEQNVIYAVANLRGGAEYGEAWHRQGALTHKQNVFDDFAAVLKHLIDHKYTSMDHLGIIGGSNGGLLMGATLVQHPHLMKTVVSYVGIYDMLRVELSPNGAFNVPEFGTVANEAQFRALYAYSPYHKVENGVKYPSVLFLTGANDPRVDPMQSRKMTSRLQAATGSSAPILLRTSSTSGHGIGSSRDERIAETADVYAFLINQLGVKYHAVK